MKPIACLSLLLLGGQIAFAGLGDFEFKTEPKLQDKQEKAAVDSLKTDEKWTYQVTMHNKSVKDFSDLEIQYILFHKHALVASKSVAKVVKRKKGSMRGAAIKGHDSLTFETEPVDLKKTQLANGYTYTNGGRPRANDALEGIWIRVFHGGQQVDEFAAPASLMTREKWDAPKREK